MISVEDLSASIWLWHRDGDAWAVTKVIDIPAEPADPADCPPLLKPFGAVPPLVTDIDLSVDDRFLYVSCWGTGELRQYDVSDPLQPGADRLGAPRRDRRAARRTRPRRTSRWPAARRWWRSAGTAGGSTSRNSLYGAWDDQFYPDGVGAWLAKLDVDVEAGGHHARIERFFPHGDEFRGLRVHQTRLQGGDASSDSYCYPVTGRRPWRRSPRSARSMV